VKRIQLTGPSGTLRQIDTYGALLGTRNSGHWRLTLATRAAEMIKSRVRESHHSNRTMGRRSAGNSGGNDKDDFAAVYHTLDIALYTHSRGSTALVFELALYSHTVFYFVLQNFNLYGAVSSPNLLFL